MVCTFGNPWYSQCVPGNLDEPLPGVPDVPIVTETQRTTVTVGGPQPTVVTTYITYLTPAPTSPPTAPPPLQPTVTVIGGVTYTFVPDAPYTPPPLPPQKHVREPTAVAPRAPTPTTLQKGQYWIRAVASPNFHKYLQTKPANEPGTALIEDYRTAGQFNIVDGQLVESSGGNPLYMNVEKPDDFTQRALATWFNTTKNTFGTFAFQGDAVTWSTPEVKRQNLAAWLVCKGQALFINTGAYAYQTPAGCADQTIHYYNGDTANN
ncbi:putative carbohydrate-binding module family 1 protein [Phaeoacremonium minimum UCRPA7]|uniref:Putative carbohydrate-binding module family 1 protein n=1 Tax=Phaeoacremonium minimum (strain UCR-PA7) TaxID=1286976 RepID=R8BEJ6_PHAM7|nr:putative carbohydrate-binding module family 1 protein [Phaeoacremonium minimum UCRPA7]EON97718.1 putative carbohydrate-binding module family 1 protein [Phaeoacremonium minimum UCRPA7]